MKNIISRICYTFGFISGVLSVLPYSILSYILYGLEMVWCFLSKKQKTKWLNDMEKYDDFIMGKDITIYDLESMYGKWCIVLFKKLLAKN